MNTHNKSFKVNYEKLSFNNCHQLPTLSVSLLLTGVLEEAKFFGITSLIEILEEMIDVRQNFNFTFLVFAGCWFDKIL